MKRGTLLIFILTSAVICAQEIKHRNTGDTLPFVVLKKTEKDTSIVKLRQFLLRNNLLYNTGGISYVPYFNDSTFKDIMESKDNSMGAAIKENLKGMQKEIADMFVDKRPWWLKIFENILGIAKVAAAVALAAVVLF